MCKSVNTKLALCRVLVGKPVRICPVIQNILERANEKKKKTNKIHLLLFQF